MESVKASATRGIAAAKKLHLMTDLLNEEIQRVEAALAWLQLGVTAQVGLKQGEKQNVYKSVLRFGKWQGRWCLTVDDGEDIVSLLQASREERLQAVSRFPDLLFQLANTVETAASRTEPRVGTAADIVDKICLIAKDEI